MAHLRLFLIASLFALNTFTALAGLLRLLCPLTFGVSDYACAPNDAPVCVVYNNGTMQTIGNQCYACSDPTDGN